MAIRNVRVEKRNTGLREKLAAGISQSQADFQLEPQES
jgi:hypothetical protein